MHTIIQFSKARSVRNRFSVSAFLFGLIATLAFQTPADARQICLNHDDALEKLNRKYQESPKSVGIASDGSLLEVLVSAKGTWTILVTKPGQPTCVVASGQDWHSRPIVVGEAL